jgi:hypothetical protein
VVRQAWMLVLRKIDQLAIASSGCEAGINHTLSLERDFSPDIVDFSAQHKVGEIAEQVRFLGIAPAVAVFGNCDATSMVFHMKVAASLIESAVCHSERGFASIVRDDKIIDVDIAFGAADVRPLLSFRQKRTVEAGRHTIFEEQLSREFRRDRGFAVGSPGLGQHPTAHAKRHLIVHHPQRKTNVVPAKVSKAAKWLKFTAGPDIVFGKFVGTTEAELAGDSPQLPDAASVIQHFPQFIQPLAVHKHDPVHELDFVLFACGDHFFGFSGITSDRLFGKNVFARLGCPNHPFLAQARGNREINGIDIGSLEQFFVASQRDRLGIKGRMRLAFVDKLLCFGGGSAGDRGNDGILRIFNGQPILAGDVCGGKNTPSTDAIAAHDACSKVPAVIQCG